jgi:hypothetical protein
LKVSETHARALLAVVLDGEDQGDGVRVPLKICDRCGNFMARFEASPGLQRKVGISAVTESCVTTTGGFLGGPCLAAAPAAPLLKSLPKAAKRTR